MYNETAALTGIGKYIKKSLDALMDARCLTPLISPYNIHCDGDTGRVPRTDGSAT